MNIKRLVLIIQISLLGLPAFSQSLILPGAGNYKKGIYKNFNEFKNNNPSIEIDFEVEEEKRWTDSRYYIYYHCYPTKIFI